jgi:hypothetical protein
MPDAWCCRALTAAISPPSQRVRAVVQPSNVAGPPPDASSFGLVESTHPSTVEQPVDADRRIQGSTHADPV